MDCAHLSDARLLRLVREQGEASFAALQQLQRRHYAAVRAFAALSAVRTTSADELAYQAWEAELRQQSIGGFGGAGAVRPGVLSAVLLTASDWARGHQRPALNPHLAAWLEANGPVMPGDTPTAGFRRPSLVAHAFAGLPHRTQTLLWHGTVERDDSALTGLLIGAGRGEVAVLSGRAHGELYNSYVQVLRDGMPDECRHYHRLVLAYAESRSGNIATEVAPHLERCARCSRAVNDLGRLRHECGAMLVQALLPWGGLEYAAARGTDEVGPRETAPPQPGSPGTGALRSLPAGSSSAAGSLVPAAMGMEPGGHGDGHGYGGQGYGLHDYGDQGYGSRGPNAPAYDGQLYGQSFNNPSFDGTSLDGQAYGAQGFTGRRSGGHAAGKGRHAGSAGSGTRARTVGKRRTDLLVRGSAVAGVCAVAAAVAFGFVGDSGSGDPQSKEPAPPVKASPPPAESSSPARTKATAKSTSNPTLKPPSEAGKDKPAPPQPSPTRTSPDPVRDAAVEWLFNGINGSSVTPDSSGNGKGGTLFGASRPTPSGGALALDGRQFVASSGPLVDTSNSFSVSARVKLDRTDVSQTVVSQDASESSAFLLQYDADESQWEMRIPEEDTGDADADADEAVSDAEVQAGEVTHLTGVYDDAADEVRLYVDGRLGETVDREDDFRSDGNFTVGRGLAGNEFFQGVDGTVDDVRAYNRALTSAEAKSLARRS